MTVQNPKIMVVLPTYNEAENLPTIIHDLFALNLENFSVLVVDDNSPDGTGSIAEELRTEYEKVHVLHREGKQGLRKAYTAGFQKAIDMGADYIIQMDSDFSHQPKYIPTMVQFASNHDLIIGSRFIKGGSVDESWSIIRKGLSWFANRIYSPTILNVPVYDSTSGYRLWKRHTLEGIGLERIGANGYVFQVEMAYIAHKLGYSIHEIPIHFPDRQKGESKMKPTIAVEASLRVWQLLFRYRKLNPSHRIMNTHLNSSSNPNNV